MKKLFYVFALLSFLITPALAQDEQKQEEPAAPPENKAAYAQPYCEFSITFPEAPEIEKICEDEAMQVCYDKISYTKVFDMTSTVRVDVICNPSNEKLYNHLSEEEMKKTVEAMSKESVLETFQINAREEEHYHQASLVGQGRAGMDDTLLVTQLWSGKKSMMSVEAELSGPQMDDADALFAEILRSVNFIEDVQTQPEAQTETPPAQDKASEAKE